ncbi:MAG: squalene--hopene cyclase [Planctomycetes bacterium]|nr:squalene--hopene cyclase [Planctomycetota bacterium]
MGRKKPARLFGRLLAGVKGGNGVDHSGAVDSESATIIDRFLTEPFKSLNGNGTLTADEHVRDVEFALDHGLDHLRSLREPDGSWSARLDSNSAITAEYILFQRFMGIEDCEREDRLARHILDTQSPEGSWSIFPGGPGHLSVSILCYFALKLAGLPTDDPRMASARRFILSCGGIAKALFECRFLLALFGQYSWKGIPHIPSSLLLAPSRFPLSIYQISYWARTSLVPMAVLYDQRVVRELPPEMRLEELWVEPPDRRRFWPGADLPFFSTQNAFILLGQGFRLFDSLSFQVLNRLGRRRAERWILSHQDESGDWGGIYPAMMYSLMALKELGYALDSTPVRKGIDALRRFQIEDGKGGIVQQACVSPIWDSAWSILALRECEELRTEEGLRAARWLLDRQIFRKGDWAVKAPDVEPGGWCFQYGNDFYPDTDDTAVVLMSLQPMMDDFTEAEREAYRRGTKWLLGLQNPDGGWAAFEKDVNKEIINYLPINDIHNMLDPSTADVTGRVLEMLGSIGFTTARPAVRAGIDFLRADQKPFGGWFGRWGVNYIYGTWSVLTGLAKVGEDMDAPYVRRAADWVKSRQNPDGGWGESCLSYEDRDWIGRGESTPSQTAWALMALVAAGEAESREARRGALFLIERQDSRGGWDETQYTGTGFPGAFYLRYYYYCLYFPLLALGRYRNAL